MKIDLRDVDQDERNKALNEIMALLEVVQNQLDLIIQAVKRMVK